MDEQRIQANRRDCLICFKVKEVPLPPQVGEGGDDLDLSRSPENDKDKRAPDRSIPETVMHEYAKFLLRPRVKVTVLLLFGVLSGCCIYSATMLTQEVSTGPRSVVQRS